MVQEKNQNNETPHLIHNDEGIMRMNLVAAVFDLDETLCCNKSRAHKLPSNKANATDEEWLKYMEGCENDPAIDSLVGLARITSRLYQVIILTARGEDQRKITEKWLRKRGIFFHELIMRPKDNRQYPWDYKRDELKKLQKTYDVQFIVEDEEKTCLEAQKLGIPSLQVRL